MTGYLAILAILGTLFAASTLAKKKTSASAEAANEAEWRRRVLTAARAELGNYDPSPYALESLGYKPLGEYEWCGFFALAVLHWAGLGTDWLWKEEEGVSRLPTTTSPQPGDLYTDTEGHHGIVEEFDNGSVLALAGNSTDGKVARIRIAPSKIRTFYSISSLIPASSG